MLLWTETETQINDLLSQGMILDANLFRMGYPPEIQLDDEVDEGKDLPVTPSDWVGKRLCGEGYEGNKRRGQESKSISFHLLFYSIISCWSKRIGKREILLEFPFLFLSFFSPMINDGSVGASDGIRYYQEGYTTASIPRQRFGNCFLYNLLLFLFVFVFVLFVVGLRFSVFFVILFSVFLHWVSLGSCFQQSNVASVMDNQRR